MRRWVSAAKTENTTIKQLTLFGRKKMPERISSFFVLDLDVRWRTACQWWIWGKITLISEEGTIMPSVLPTYVADIIHDIFFGVGETFS